jgi:uncharacterized membrane protein
VLIHWRLASGILMALGVWALAVMVGAPEEMRPLIGWDAGAIVYLALAWRLFATATEDDVRGRAAREDESRGVILAVVVVAVVAAVSAIIGALIEVRAATAGRHAAVAALAGLTLVVSWVVLQSVFVAHYAHRHFQTLEGGTPGVIFPGEPARTYMDFVYLAFCVGATAQVSDPNIATTRLRNLVTTHAALSFFYNTTVLALGINIIAGLVGR